MPVLRFGFRHFLPVAVTALYVFLMLWGLQIEVRHSTRLGANNFQNAAFQESAALPEFRAMEPKPPSAPTRVAIGLNFPACLIVALVTTVLNIESEMGLVWGGAAVGFYIWYLIGHWLDTVIGLLPRKVARHPNLRDLTLFTLGPLSGFALVISVLSMTPVNHHGGADRYWVGIILTFWSGMFVAVMADALRNRKVPVCR